MPSSPSLFGHPRVQLAVALGAVALAGVSALSMVGEVRLVSIIVLFFGGFGAGASLVAAVGGHRLRSLQPSAIPVGADRDADAGAPQGDAGPSGGEPRG